MNIDKCLETYTSNENLALEVFELDEVMTMGHSPLWTSTYSSHSWGITGLLMDRSQRWWMICSLCG